MLLPGQKYDTEKEQQRLNKRGANEQLHIPATAFLNRELQGERERERESEREWGKKR